MILSPAGYLDSHCHLQANRLLPVRDAMFERAGAAGVARMLCNATSEKDWQAVVELAITRQAVLPFLGIHPWWAETATSGWDQRLRSLLAQTAAGVGEIGLDKCCRADFGQQQLIFETQLQMAVELSRPIVIHCVKAWGRIVALLEQLTRPRPPIMIHAFSGSEDILQRLIRLGCFISFSARLDNDPKVHHCVLATPLTNLLLESDAPGQPNNQTVFSAEPAAIIQLYRLVATLKEMPLDEFRQEIWKNGEIFTHTILPR